MLAGAWVTLGVDALGGLGVLGMHGDLGVEILSGLEMLVEGL